MTVGAPALGMAPITGGFEAKGMLLNVKNLRSPIAPPSPFCYCTATPEAPDSSGALGLFVPVTCSPPRTDEPGIFGALNPGPSPLPATAR
jgi:hypothetical protein